MKMYAKFAQVAQALNARNISMVQLDAQTAMLDKLTKLSPSGSGFDKGTEFVSVRSGDTRLVFQTAFYHVDEDDAAYSQWSHHTVYATPSLLHGIVLKVTGDDISGIKSLIAVVFYNFLKQDYPE